VSGAPTARDSRSALLEEPQFVQAAHIIEDRSPERTAAMVNRIALSVKRHLAYDRNLLRIEPAGAVHIAGRLLNEVDGSILTPGLQGFHGKSIAVPRRPGQCTDRPS
jgi:hypothetical protein